MYPIGGRLCTLDGTKFGNGIIIGHAPVHDTNHYQIESDFGNVYYMSEQEVDDHFWVDVQNPDTKRWYEARENLRSRSSMTEQGIVDPQDAGLVPAVTATV